MVKKKKCISSFWNWICSRKSSSVATVFLLFPNGMCSRKCDPLTLLEAACTMAYCMYDFLHNCYRYVWHDIELCRRERFRPGQDFLNAFERRLEGTTLAFDHFWSTVQYCCNARSRASETCDVSQPLISALLEKAIKEDDPMWALLKVPFHTLRVEWLLLLYQE